MLTSKFAHKKFRNVFDFKGIHSFWDSVRTIGLIKLDDLSKPDSKHRAEAALLLKHQLEFDEIIAGKSIGQLEELEKEVDKILSGDQFTLDIDYWDFLLMMIKKRKALLVLSDFFNNMKSQTPKAKGFPQSDSLYFFEAEEKEGLREAPEVSIPFEELKEDNCDDSMTLEEFKAKLHSERVNSLNNIVAEFITEIAIEHIQEEDKIPSFVQHILDLTNKAANDGLSGRDGNDHASDALSQAYLHNQLKHKQGKDDLSWIQNYRPRKPHYFNRVKLGYEWNKINQAHYTLDNPPPREVFGYKFNIFYPSLLDAAKIPSFKLIPTESPDFIIITFTAGPPYEDLSFRIVNKQWDMADRKSFKCIFDRGVLTLYFDFVKNRHRR